jgi:hypothetical protein
MYLFNNFSYWIPGVQIPTYLEITNYSSMFPDNKSKGGRPTHGAADPQCLSRLPNPFSYQSRIPDPATATKEGGGGYNSLSWVSQISPNLKFVLFW